MSRFLETICVNGGEPALLPLHQERVDRTREFHFPGCDRLWLADHLPPELALAGGRVKLRIIYGVEVELVEWHHYTPAPIHSLKVVQVEDSFDYSWKSAERSSLELLRSRRDGCDEILILRRGEFTDTSYANLLFELPDGTFQTPQNPLLAGVKRKSLLQQNRIEERSIGLDQLEDYRRVHLINAMLDPGEVVIPVERIRSDS